MSAPKPTAAQALDQLLDIMARLRAPNGCPWDREQTLASLKPFLIEESYEVLDAIDSGDRASLKDELGDVLLQLVFQSQICREEGSFEFADCIANINAKLIRRHPHVFGDTVVADSDEVLRNWESIKKKERSEDKRSVLGSVPRSMPALQKAQHVQKKAARVGFDWREPAEVIAKIEEEIEEIREALAGKPPEALREEVGDLLFAIVNLCRFLGFGAEEELNRAVTKFTRRFQSMEQRIREQQQEITACPIEELEAHWTAVKKDEQGPPG